MKKNNILFALCLSLVILTAFSTRTDPTEKVPYPTGYRNWTHVKSKVALSNSAGNKSGTYHHIYANSKAMDGYKTGKFPEGAVIVADFITAVDSNTSLFEGQRQYIDVMIKSTAQYAANGGWGFEEFDKGDENLRKVVTLGNAQTTCFKCHQKQVDHDFVFSRYRD